MKDRPLVTFDFVQVPSLARVAEVISRHCYLLLRKVSVQINILSKSPELT